MYLSPEKHFIVTFASFSATAFVPVLVVFPDVSMVKSQDQGPSFAVHLNSLRLFDTMPSN